MEFVFPLFEHEAIFSVDNVLGYFYSAFGGQGVHKQCVVRRVRHKGVVDLIREQYFLFRFGNGGVVIVAVRINYIRSAYRFRGIFGYGYACLLYTSDAADD